MPTIAAQNAAASTPELRWTEREVLLAEEARRLAALSRSYQLTGEPRFLRAAEEVRLFLKTRLSAGDYTLCHSFRDREALGEATAEDYALYLWGLLALYQAGFSVSCLREAAGVAGKLLALSREGKLDLTGAGEEAAAALSLGLWRLYRLTLRSRFYTPLEPLRSLLAKQGGSRGAAALRELDRPARLLVCASAGEIPPWLAQAAGRGDLLAVGKTWDNARGLENLAPYLAACALPERGVQLYLIRDGESIRRLDVPSFFQEEGTGWTVPREEPAGAATF